MANDYGVHLTRQVAAQIEVLRHAQSMSLDDLARASGMHRTSIGLIVRGRRGLTIERAADLARALGVPLSELIAEAERDLDES